MNSKNIMIGGIICLLWWVHEILSLRVHENITETKPSQFIMGTDPTPNYSSSFDSEEELLQPETSQMNEWKSNESLPNNENYVKTQQNIADRQKMSAYLGMTAQQFKNPPTSNESDKKETKNNKKNIFQDKQQKWKIPSPITHESLIESRANNSSKRQTDHFSERDFVPSLEVGSFDGTQGFVPHSIHEPKTLPFPHIQTIFAPNKPSTDESSYNSEKFKQSENPFYPDKKLQSGVTIQNKQSNPDSDKTKFSIHSQPALSSYQTEPKLPPQHQDFENNFSDSKFPPRAQNNLNNFQNIYPPQLKSSCINDNSNEINFSVIPKKGFQSFRRDFDNLKTKYPELNDLINNYPIMEEIMNQKLLEKFKSNIISQKQTSSLDNSFEINNSEEAGNDKIKFSSDYGLPLKYTNFKFPSTEDGKVNLFSGIQSFKGVPYQFEGKKPSWLFNKKPSSEEGSQEVPAGEFYQKSRFPVTAYAHDDKKDSSEEDKKPFHIMEYQPHMVSPWKKAINLLTAFLPVGLLISALTPAIININTTDQTFPVRQRSMDGRYQLSKLNNPLGDLLRGKIPAVLDQLQVSSDPDCEEWNFCQLAKKGETAAAMSVEKIFWKLAHDVPDNIAEKAGMKKLFKAIKSGDCSSFHCKKRNKAADASNVEEDDDEGDYTEPLEDFEDIYDGEEIEIDPREAVETKHENTSVKPISIVRREKRTH